MQVAVMEQNPNVGLSYARAERRDENGDLIGYFPTGEGHTSLDALLHDWCIENCTTLARKDLVLDYYATEKPENRPEWLTEDLPMWLYLAARSEVAYINRVMAVHRVFPDSVSHSSSLAKRLALTDLSERPVLQGRTEEELLSFIAPQLEAREPFYSKADYTLSVEQCDENADEYIAEQLYQFVISNFRI